MYYSNFQNKKNMHFIEQCLIHTKSIDHPWLLKKEVFPVLSLSLTVPFIICYYFENDFYGWKSSKLF